MHSRKSLLFNNGDAWIKKDNSSFGVTISYDGAEVCELVGLFILNGLGNTYGKENIGLYRDDGLAVFKNITEPQADSRRRSNSIPWCISFRLILSLHCVPDVIIYFTLSG